MTFEEEAKDEATQDADDYEANEFSTDVCLWSITDVT